MNLDLFIMESEEVRRLSNKLRILKDKIFPTRARVKKIHKIMDVSIDNMKKISDNIDNISDEINSIANTMRLMSKDNERFLKEIEKNSEILKNLKIDLFPNTNRINCYWFKKFKSELKEIELNGAYRRLISNLDSKSIRIVNKMLALSQEANDEGFVPYPLYSPKELDYVNEIVRHYRQGIVQLSENCYTLDGYMLPIAQFAIEVFVEKHGLEDLKNLSKIREKHIIDAGGYIGDSALLFSSYTNKSVFSFEPTQKNYKYLCQTIKLNELKNVVPQKCALGSSESSVEMYVDGNASGSVFNMRGVKEIELVPVQTLDNFVEKHGLEVGLIKSDVEGAEQDLLKGAQRTIRQQKPTLIISIYHSARDFFDIKPMIEEWNLGYKFRIAKPIDRGIFSDIVLIAEVEE